MSLIDNELPAGWYPDPNQTTMERYWDGQQWTLEARRPLKTDDKQKLPMSFAALGSCLLLVAGGILGKFALPAVILCAALAVIVGIFGIRETKKGGYYRGRGTAVAGVVFGSLLIAFAILITVGEARARGGSDEPEVDFDITSPSSISEKSPAAPGTEVTFGDAFVVKTTQAVPVTVSKELTGQSGWTVTTTLSNIGQETVRSFGSVRLRDSAKQWCEVDNYGKKAGVTSDKEQAQGLVTRPTAFFPSTEIAPGQTITLTVDFACATQTPELVVVQPFPKSDFAYFESR